MNAQLQLLFHADHLKFTLIREFGDWRREFSRLKEALCFARTEGAKELPFLVLDEGELYSESVITVEPKDRNKAISDPEELSAFIGRSIQNRGECRVFSNVLARCWNVPRRQQQEAVEGFAKEHGWEVRLHEPAGYGVVADFSRGKRSHENFPSSS